MPYKTQYGSHYHLTYGCHGATIPCDASGLTPCSDCCGGGSKDGGTEGGMVGGTPLGAGSGAAGSEPYFMSLTDDVDIAIAACDEGDTVILEDGNVLVFREASESGLPENGYIIEEPTRGVPLRIATEDDLYDIGEQVREGVATLGSGETWDEHKARIRAEAGGQPDTPQSRQDAMRSALTEAARASEARTEPWFAPSTGISPELLGALDGMGIDPVGSAPAPVPPMPRNIGQGFYIDVDGTIVRDGGQAAGIQAAQDAASEMVRRFDNAAPARWSGPDYAEKARTTLLSRIENEIRDMPDGHDKEAFRKCAQQVWNTMHPEAPVLEWSRDDEGYVSDTEQVVVMRRRNYDEMRDFNHGSNEIGYDYLVMDKETGECVNDRIHAADVAVRQVERRIADIEQDMEARANQEIAQQQAGLYGDWLSEKRQQSNAWIYHAGASSWDSRRELWDEFVRDTGYERPRPSLRPTDEEREQLAELNQRQRDARIALDNIMVRYGIDDQVVWLISPQYSRRTSWR